MKTTTCDVLSTLIATLSCYQVPNTIHETVGSMEALDVVDEAFVLCLRQDSACTAISQQTHIRNIIKKHLIAV